MESETILVFALGMIFYHGVISAAGEKTIKIASVVALVLFFHKATSNMHMREFLERLPASTGAVMHGGFLFIGALTVLESFIAYLVKPFLSAALVSVLEKIGGVFTLLALLLIFSSLWILSRNDIRLCVFIDHGIYAYIRHPYYLGLAFLYVGICLTLGNICSIIIAIITLKNKIADFIRDEETILIDRHRSYMKYRERVPSGVPVDLVHAQKSVDSFSSATNTTIMD